MHKSVAFVRKLSDRSRVNPRLKQIILDRFKHGYFFSGGVTQRNRNLPFVNITDYILHGTRINPFQLGNMQSMYP